MTTVEHVIYCRGCRRAWREPDCGCTCANPADPLYEAWIVDPTFTIPERAWSS